MKLNKVKIQAFRIYNRVDDGTFDFTVNGEPADFVSIYAPNGFGKTSFYNAIEWGITGEVKRLSSQKDNLKKQRFGKNNGRPEDQILVNEFAKPGTPTSVTLELDNGDSISNILGKKRRSNDSVDSSIIKRILLDQEGIDAFLRTDKPEDRYEEWAKHFGRHGVEPYFKTISHLLTLNEEEIDKLQKEISLLEGVGFSGNLSKLDTLNAHIVKLQAKGIGVGRVDDGFDEDKWVEFVQTLDVLTVETEGALELATQGQSDVREAIKGSLDVVGCETYLQIPVEIEHLRASLNKSVDLGNAVDRITKTEDSIAQLNAEIKSIVSNIADLQNLKKRFPKYQSIVKSIALSESELEETESERVRNSMSLASVEESHAESDRSVADLAKQISVLSTQIETFPETVKELEGLQSHRNVAKKDSEKNTAALTKLRTKELQPLKASFERTERIIDAVTKGNFGIRLVEPDPELTLSMGDLRRLKAEIADRQAGIGDLDAAISNLDSLGSDLESLLTIAMRVIDSNVREDCPVCLTDFGSSQKLSERVRSNNALSSQKKELSDRRKKVAADENKLNRELKDLTNRLLDVLRSRKQQIGEKISSIEQEEIRLVEKASSIANDIAESDERIAVHSTVFLGLTPQVYLKQIRRDVAALTRRLDLEKGKQDKLAAQVLTLSKTAARLTNRIDSLRSKLEKEQKGSTILDFGKAATDAGLDLPVELASIQASLEAVQKLRSEADSRVASLTKQLQNDRDLVAGKRRQRIETDIAKISESIERLAERSSHFESFITDRLGIKTAPRPTLGARLRRTLEKAEQDLKQKREVSSLLKKVISMRKSVEPFISYWGNQKRLAERNKEVELKKRIGADLATEKSRVGSEIKGSIKAFFHEDLINKFYEVIDPHPFYKTIAFDYDFQSAKPKLDVFIAKDVSDPLKSVPNLFLSAAQINVMSLSIFLARSLRATSDPNSLQCIFVDDPIQSMDSINILSTIDLLRSISVNLNKQIILSTHDENFHNLLKRKLPEERFRSKFIELETYGKVKRVRS